MTIDRLAHESEFIARLQRRWQIGAQQYGDVSFDKPLARTAEEILAEIEDIAGWAFIAWTRIREQMRRVDQAAADLGLDQGPLAAATGASGDSD